MTIKKWIALISLAIAVGSILSFVWTGEWRWLFTALIVGVISFGSYSLAVTEEHVSNE